MKLILFSLTVCVVLYALATMALYHYQRNLIYFPTPAIEHPFNTEQLVVDDGQRNAIVLNPGQQHAVLYFGGNAEAAALSADAFRPHIQNKTFYFIEYSGYGSSTGMPSEAQLYTDALAWHDHLANRHSQLSVIGRSLGSGVATYLAANRTLHRLVLVTPFDSVLHVAQQRFSLFPVSLLLKDQFRSDTRIPNITTPALLMIAEHDSIVPAAHALALADLFPETQKTVHIFKAETHNTIGDNTEYFPTLLTFLASPKKLTQP